MMSGVIILNCFVVVVRKTVDTHTRNNTLIFDVVHTRGSGCSLFISYE